MASIDSKVLPVPLTSDLAQLLGMAAKRGYSNKALMALARSAAASKANRPRPRRKAVRRG